MKRSTVSEPYPMEIGAEDLMRPDTSDPIRQGLIEMCSQIAIATSLFPEATSIDLLDDDAKNRTEPYDRDGFKQLYPLPIGPEYGLKSDWQRNKKSAQITGEIALPSINKGGAWTQILNEVVVSGREVQEGNLPVFVLESFKAQRRFFRVNDSTIYVHRRNLRPQPFIRELNAGLGYLHNPRSLTHYEAK